MVICWSAEKVHCQIRCLPACPWLQGVCVLPWKGWVRSGPGWTWPGLGRVAIKHIRSSVLIPSVRDTGGLASHFLHLTSSSLSAHLWPTLSAAEVAPAHCTGWQTLLMLRHIFRQCGLLQPGPCSSRCLKKHGTWSHPWGISLADGGGLTPDSDYVIRREDKLRCRSEMFYRKKVALLLNCAWV